MRLAVVHLTGGGFSGGFVKYGRVVLPLLAADPRIERLFVLDPPGSDVDWGAGERHAWPGRDWVRGFAGLKAKLRELRPDAVFIPTARWIDAGVPTAVMVRNMEPLVTPFGGNPLPEAARNVARRRAARRAARRADRVVAVSGFVRDWVVGRWKVDAQRVAVIPHGVDLREGEGARPAALSGADFPFVFTAGSIRPARGAEDAISALGALGRFPQLRLVVAGGVEPGAAGYRARLEALARGAGVADRVVWAGQLNAAEMAWCYRRCRAFVMTSRVEACPNVVLEALSHGAVSVSDDNPPMPEFFRDAALYYPTGNAAALAARLDEALSAGEDRRAAWSAAARGRAAGFTWRRTAELTARALLDMAERGPRGAARPPDFVSHSGTPER
jgi:glycosyltransferase involved in cell wall biosynthesis